MLQRSQQSRHTWQMITEDTIKTEIEKLEREKADLKTIHETMVREDQQRQQVFQQAVVKNQNRFQQISGAIAQLQQLLNGKKPPK